MSIRPVFSGPVTYVVIRMLTYLFIPNNIKYEYQKALPII